MQCISHVVSPTETYTHLSAPQPPSDPLVPESANQKLNGANPLKFPVDFPWELPPVFLRTPDSMQADTTGVSASKSQDFAAWYTQVLGIFGLPSPTASENYPNPNSSMFRE